MLGALFGAIALGLPRALQVLPKGAGRAIGWAVCGLALVPWLAGLRPAPAADARPQTLARSTLQWMHDRLPAVDPVTPQWGVIAPAGLRQLLMLWSSLPAVGNVRASEALNAHDDEALFATAQSAKARYLLLNISAPKSVDEAATWCHHLWESGGAAGGDKAASGHFRLIYSAREHVEGRPYARVFEVVPGAVLKGMAEPGSTVTAGVWARVDGPDLAYKVTTQAGADGVYAVRVAQPGKYFVHRDHSSVEVLVTEENLRLGSELHEPRSDE
jgi:dolichyl-diphosphooligosaccharide--protein glycosyltransferase